MILLNLSLPNEVITYLIRCHMFFRMRELNRNIVSSSFELESWFDSGPDLIGASPEREAGCLVFLYYLVVRTWA